MTATMAGFIEMSLHRARATRSLPCGHDRGAGRARAVLSPRAVFVAGPQTSGPSRNLGCDDRGVLVLVRPPNLSCPVVAQRWPS